MTGYSRFIIVSFLHESATQKEFQLLCQEFGSIRNCRIQKSDKGFMSGFCEYDNCDSATAAVRILNQRSTSEGSSLRASFSKARNATNTRSCHLRVKYLPLHVTQDEILCEFGKFGMISRCKLVLYERNATAHISYEKIEDADQARQSLNNQFWGNNPENAKILIEYNSAYYSNGRKSNSLHPEDDFVDSVSYNHNSMPIEDAVNTALYQQTSAPQINPYYNFVQQPYVTNSTPIQPLDMSQDYQTQPQKTGTVQTAQYVQLSPYYYPTQQPSVMPPQQMNIYESSQNQTNGITQTTNGLASSPPIKPSSVTHENTPANSQWAQFYSQIVQQMQNTHLYNNSSSQYTQQPTPSYGIQQNPAQSLILNPQSVYCATAFSPTPQNYPLIFNPSAGSYFRGIQPTLPQTGFRYNSGPQFRTNLSYLGATLSKNPHAPTRGNNNNNNNNTLYVYNTGNSMTEDRLRSLFSQFGTITDVSVPRDPLTGSARNFGFVNYLEPASAGIAIEQMNGFMLYDRVLQVSYKRPRISNNMSRGCLTREKKELDAKIEQHEVSASDEKKQSSGESEETEHNKLCEATSSE